MKMGIIDKDLTDAYVLGMKFIQSQLYETAKGTINYIRVTGKHYPEYKTISETYALNLEAFLKTNNAPIVSDIKGLSLENKMKQWETK